jgi:hypothetical protein
MHTTVSNHLNVLLLIIPPPYCQICCVYLHIRFNLSTHQAPGVWSSSCQLAA